MDHRAVGHILSRSYDYPKPALMREGLGEALGKGVLVAEGDIHRRQRRIMNPCFGTMQIRNLMPIFYTKAFELRDIWLNEVSGYSGQAEVDVAVWLSRMTLDVIGLAGFNYNFNSLVEGETNELARAFHDLSAPETPFRLLLKLFKFSQSPPLVALLNLIPTERRRLEWNNKEVMDRVCEKLVQEKKAALVQEKKDASGNLLSNKVEERDLLSVLARANLSSDLKGSDRMTDDEMMGQITTMLVAGHDTTSTSITWLLFNLAKPDNKPIQDNLRAELLTLSSDEPSMEELNTLPYLDAVIKENLRINPVLPRILREAARDNIIPLSVPVMDRKGMEKNEIRIGKGDMIAISVLAINRDRVVWGDDAHDFNPERWFNPDTHPRSAEIPGVHSGIMTFISGPRHRIGYRFALMEMKALVLALLRNIQYSLPVPTLEVVKSTT
ncbi:hypothetical protein FRB95_011268 [Tulasnella sp. JGI-2019a]|nr:hypothetical protein FRB95_011268 [Tulasnella sp. JGI-2019a]